MRVEGAHSFGATPPGRASVAGALLMLSVKPYRLSGWTAGQVSAACVVRIFRLWGGSRVIGEILQALKLQDSSRPAPGTQGCLGTLCERCQVGLVDRPPGTSGAPFGGASGEQKGEVIKWTALI